MNVSKLTISGIDVQFDILDYTITNGILNIKAVLPSYYDWKFEETSDALNKINKSKSKMDITINKSGDISKFITTFKDCTLQMLEINPVNFLYTISVDYLLVNEKDDSVTYVVSESTSNVKPSVISLAKTSETTKIQEVKEKDISKMTDSEKRDYIAELNSKIEEVKKTFDTPISQIDQDLASGGLILPGCTADPLSQKYKIINATDNVRYQILSLKKSFSEDTPHTDFLDYGRPYSFQELLNNQIHWARMCEDNYCPNEEFYGPIVDFVEDIVKSYNELLEKK